MNREDIIRMVREAHRELVTQDYPGHLGQLDFWTMRLLERVAALVAAEKEQQMLRDGWRQCAKGQRTTQYCGLLDAAVKAEREACAKYLDDCGEHEHANYIRSRGEVKP